MAITIITLLDDIASFTKDIAAITQTTFKKTAGVLGDDLALNAEQVTGVSSKRELPVIWAVFKGSMMNKAIIVPLALLLHFYLPFLFTPLLMLGGAFLAFEGAHAVIEKFFSKEAKAAHEEQHKSAIKDESIDMVAFEKNKIRTAIRTDFILSAEIIAISLSTMTNLSTEMKIIGLIVVSILITVFVYGLVAMLVRMDDVGLKLIKKESAIVKKIGYGMIQAVPHIMTALSWIGMIALFLVGGGILLHGFHSFAHIVEVFVGTFASSGVSNVFAMMAAEGIVGLIAGFILVGVEIIVRKLIKK